MHRALTSNGLKHPVVFIFKSRSGLPIDLYSMDRRINGMLSAHLRRDLVYGVSWICSQVTSQGRQPAVVPVSAQRGRRVGEPTLSYWVTVRVHTQRRIPAYPPTSDTVDISARHAKPVRRCDQGAAPGLVDWPEGVPI